MIRNREREHFCIRSEENMLFDVKAFQVDGLSLATAAKTFAVSHFVKAYVVYVDIPKKQNLSLIY
jgi:hypothetical protein